MNAPQDRAARDAARLVAEGRASSIEAALSSLSAGRELAAAARRHLDAMDLSRLGDSGVDDVRRDMLEAALAVMETIDLMESRLADAGTPYRGVRLMGDAAKGRPHLRGRIHLRVHGDRTTEAWADELALLEPQASRTFTSATRYGRLSGLEVTLEGTVVRIHRCPVDQVPLDAGHLFDGSRIRSADLPTVRRLVDATGTS